MKEMEIGQALTGLAWLLVCGSPAFAGSIAVSPVRVTLSAKQPVAAIRVQNEGSEATVIQLDTSAWSQHDGESVLTETGEVLATPPILTIAPGGSRIVRVGLRRPPDAHRELTYRIMLREVPPPEPVAHGLRVALQISMPVFVVPAVPVAADLHWRAVRTADNRIRLLATNSGTAHIQLGRLELTPAGAGPIAVQDTATYILPGNTHEWDMSAKSVPAVGSALRVSSQVELGKVQAEMRLEDAASDVRTTAMNVTAH
jgi:fimbrial chaperone protein